MARGNGFFSLEMLPYFGFGVAGVIGGPHIYDAVVGPQILEHLGLGGLNAYGSYAEFGTNIALSLVLMSIYDRFAYRR